MLVLTRKLQETIQIGDQVTIHILRVKGNTVRLGIDAPRHIRVIRGELVDQESVAGEQPAVKAPLNPIDSRETDTEDPAVEDDSTRPRAALADYFPRVRKTVHFPLATFDTNHDPLGSH